MKSRLVILTALLSVCHVVRGQAAPAGVATSENYFTTSLLPTLGSTFGDGIIHYSLGAGEIIQYGLYSGSNTNFTTNLSGTVGYGGNNPRFPFSMLYAGGLLLTNFDQASAQTYQNATVSQGFVITPRMNFSVSDSVSYLPQSPTTGYSGIPGVGDLGTIGPAQGPAGGILTYYGKRVSNSLNGGLERKLTASTSISGSAGWDILRFVDGVGVDTTSLSGSAALNHRLNGRTTVSGNVTYAIFTFGNYGPLTDPFGLSNLSIQTRGANLAVSRLLTRSLTLSASGGPQFINSSNSTLAPPRTTASGSVGLTYVHKITTASFSYARGASGGSGVQQGSLMDTVSASVSRAYGHDWQASITGNYTHSDALITNALVNRYLGVNGTYNTVFAGVQVSHRLGVHTSMYAGYTVQQQSGSNSVGSVNSPTVFNGVANIFSIGITWTPQSTRLGQF